MSGDRLSQAVLTTPAWHALDADAVARALGSDAAAGLSEAEAAARLRRHGPNLLAPERRVTVWGVVREEATEPLILLLLGVGVLYALSGELRDAVAIVLIIAGVIAVEVFNEYRAKAAIAALGRLAAPTAPVVRAGRARLVAATALVPGDLVLLRPGERVPADLRLTEARGLRADESSLTGESGPVDKATALAPPDAALADRASLVFAGTLVTAGRGRGLVVATGAATELGRVAGLAQAAREPRTPLQQAMRELSGWLVWLALGFSALVPILGLLAGLAPREMLLTGLTLAFATIPEELPILITVVLGLGALRLARRRAIVKRLRAAEALGSVSAIAVDKTGTLTANRLAVAELWLSGRREPLPASGAGADAGARRALGLAVLASEAPADRGDGAGPVLSHDPTELALLAGAAAAGLEPAALRAGGPVAEPSFDERRLLAWAAYRRADHVVLAVKGAAETVVARCVRSASASEEAPLDEAGRRAALAAAAELARRGLRVLAVAGRRLPVGTAPDAALVDSGLTLAGLVGLDDPPRPQVPAALAELRAAGIRVLMLTGDHPATARAIAERVGIVGGVEAGGEAGQRVLLGRELDALDEAGLRAAVGEVAVFARIAPEHKLRLVRALQARGEVVAVTGDGVNDAPALRQAEVGVAMGETGTDVAKEAADVVLADDDFATVAVAVREGRQLFDNLRKAVRYYLAAKVALVSASLAAVLAQLALPVAALGAQLSVPFAPIQIILMELLMDLGASLAFTAEPAEEDVMARPPRDPRQPFVDESMRLGIFGGGLSLAAAVAVPYFLTALRGADVRHAQSVAFAAWMVGHLALAAQMRTERVPLLRRGLAGALLGNRALLLWAAGAVALLVAALYLPWLQPALRTAPLGAADWLLVLAAALLAPLWLEALRLRRARVRERPRRAAAA